ncbi:MAG TPA: MAPEG family protein [Rhizomicrobium sp.]|nr:MAPEG family protein [Rhizomicrobium sp.]
MNIESLPSFTLGHMSVEMTALALAIVLGFVHLFIAVHVITNERGFMWNMGARDTSEPLASKLAGRLDRAFWNFLETFPFFAAAVLMAAILGRHSWQTVLGAELYIAGRVIYLPLYALGIPFIRTLVWLAATIGIFLVLAALFAG